MRARRLKFDAAARESLKAGVDAVADAVRLTLGPQGRNVLFVRPADDVIKDKGGLTITNDGVTVARQIDLADPFANQGALFLREAAIATNDDVGDGTTTSALLAQAILSDGMRNVAAGANPVGLRTGIQIALGGVVEHLRGQAIDVSDPDQTRRVATLAAGDEEIGDAVSGAFEEVGREGVVNIETGNTMGIELEIAEGMQWDRGFVSPYMVTHADRSEAVLEEPYILFADMRLDDAHDLIPIVEKVKEAGKPLFVVAKYVKGEALAMLLVNKMQGKITAAACEAPDFARRRRRMMDDMAVMTGGSVVSDESGHELRELELSDLGRARQVVSGRRKTTIIGGLGDPEEVRGRFLAMRRELEETELSFYERKFSERLARLAGLIALIKVGAPTDSEITERKLRAEDAVHATRAALEEGILPGGGTALLRAREAIDTDGLDADAAAGAEILRRALAEPLRQIAVNSGFEGLNVVERVAAMGPTEGFDARGGDYGDLIERGVIDPTKVARSALENAVSVAKTVLTAEAIVVDVAPPPPPEWDPSQIPGSS